MELNIADLAIEVTRKCNMKCEHCLRGNSQRKTIDNQYIYKMLQLIDNVGTLTIAGGEPTLSMDSLQQIRHCIIYGNRDVSSFYMVTNGKAINLEAMAEWIYDMHNCCSDNEMSSIGFSFDSFHTQTFNWKQSDKHSNNYYRLQDMIEMNYGLYNSSGESYVTKHSDENLGYHNLLKEGRAKDFGTRDNNIQFFEEDNYKDTIYFNEEVLYLTCSGYIVAGCNWSYHNMDNNKAIQIAHIDDIRCTDDLIEAIRVYNKKKERVLQERVLQEV